MKVYESGREDRYGRNVGRGSYIGSHGTTSVALSDQPQERGESREYSRDGAYALTSTEVEVGSWAMLEREVRHPNGCVSYELQLAREDAAEPDWARIRQVCLDWARRSMGTRYPKIVFEEIPLPQWGQEELEAAVVRMTGGRPPELLKILGSIVWD